MPFAEFVTRGTNLSPERLERQQRRTRRGGKFLYQALEVDSQRNGQCYGMLHNERQGSEILAEEIDVCWYDVIQ